MWNPALWSPTRRLVAVALAVALTVVGLVGIHWWPSTAEATAAGPCAAPAVLAEVGTVPIINVNAGRTVKVPAGEPSVVALVNGQGDICGQSRGPRAGRDKESPAGAPASSAERAHKHSRYTKADASTVAAVVAPAHD